MSPAVVTLRVAVMLALLLVGCTNDPYPAGDDAKKIVYVPFETPTKTLDPAVAYTTVDHAVTGPVYDTLLEYHYLDRPYRLIPGLALAVPEREGELDATGDAHVAEELVRRDFGP
jgi:ABC-type oligopeptide transport system substrate-binding subunit